MSVSVSALDPRHGVSRGGYSSVVTITELVPGGVTITLQGASLPFRGAEWGGELNMTTTWYPGNPDEATQQVLGPRELPTHWRGEWKRTLMGKSDSHAVVSGASPPNVVAPWILRDSLEALFRRGARLAVTWSTAGVSPTDVQDDIYREGRARSWKFQHDRAQDIKWEVEFNWLGRGRTQQRATSVRDDTATSATNALASAIDALTKLIVPPLDPFTSFLRSLQKGISQIQNAIATAQHFATLPFSIANQIVGTVRDMQAVCNQTLDMLGRQPAELLALRLSVHDLTNAYAHQGQVGDAVVNAARQANRAGSVLVSRVFSAALRGQRLPSTNNVAVSDVLAVYITRQGDTPHTVSMRYYGTPDHDIDILKANDLPWSQPSFPPGQALIIPNLQTVKKA